MSYTGDGPTEKGERRLGRVQAARPSPDCGGIGQAIGILKPGQSLLPWTVLCNAQQQCLTACQQTVMRVREREHRKEGEGLPAINTLAAMYPNPVVILVVSLLAAAAVTNDRIAFTKRASAYDDLVAVFRPAGCKLIRREGNWDKEDRTSQGFRLWLRPAKIIDGSGTPPPEKNATERKYTFLPTGRRA